jgi:DNA polymerase-3 subunit delta
LLYILAGPDDYSRTQTLEQIKKGLGDPGMLAAATTRLDGPEVTPDGLREMCQTLPFLSDKRLVVLRGLLERFEGRPASADGSRA